MIPYKEYVKANLLIPDLIQYTEDMLFFVISDNKYIERVPVQLGTLVVDHLVVTMIMEELQQVGDTWKQVYFSTVIKKRRVTENPSIPEYDLEEVKGKCELHRK